MENKEYVMEKIAINYAGKLGRVLAFFGNENAKLVVNNFKKYHDIALKKGLTTQNLGGFMKEMGRSPEVAKRFIYENSALGKRKAAEAAANLAKDGGEGMSIFKPWSKKAKVAAGIGAGVAAAGGGAYLLTRKPSQPTEEELYQQMYNQQMPGSV